VGHTDLPDEDVAALQAALEKMTPGDWKVVRQSFVVGGKYDELAAAQQGGALIDWICSAQCSNQPNFRNDIEGIVLLRNLLPRVLAERTEMKERLDDALETIELGNDPKFVDSVWQARLEAAESQLSALRQVVEQVRAIEERMAIEQTDTAWHPMYRNALFKFGRAILAALPERR
jgi:hypothetical protein